MRQLSESLTVRAPSSFALAYMTTYFLERGPQSSAKVALRFPLPNFVIDGLTIEKLVPLKLKYEETAGGLKQIVIAWQPAATKSLPSFSGRLTAAAQTEKICTLTVDGGYIPPGGIAGSIFDSLIGARIAHATLAALLTEFARAIEADYLARLP